MHLYKIKAKLCFPEREKSNGSSRNDKEKSQETALYIYTEYTKEEYLTIRMEIVILLVTGKLPILSFIARDMQIHSWYLKCINTHTHKHTHAHIIIHTREKGNKRSARITFHASNQTWQRMREIKKLRTNIRLINFIIRLFTRDFFTIKNKWTLKYVLKFSSHTNQNCHRSSVHQSSLWQDTFPPEFPRQSTDLL